MRSWATGKQELLQELEKVYDSIGQNLLAELGDQSTARVNTAQLQLLQDRSSKYQDLIERHPDFEHDLREHKSICLRLDELADSNKRLAAELEQARRKQASVPSSSARPDHFPSDPTIPLATASTSPRLRQLFNSPQINAGTELDREALVDRCNTVYKQWEIEKDGRKSYEAKWKRERDKVKDWVKYSERQDKSIAYKKDKIKKLKEELRYLQSHPDGVRVASDKRLSDGPSRSPTEIPKSIPPEVSPLSSPLPKANAQPLGATKASRSPKEDILAIMTAPEPELQEPMVVSPTLLGQISRDETQDLHQPALSNNQKTIILDSQAESDNESPIYQEPNTMRQDPTPKEERESVRRTNKVKLEACSDDHESPVVVSARTIKKRKRRNEPDEPRHVPNIKQEIISSSPIGINAFDTLASNNSVDLDDIGQKVDTPRKHRRRLFELSQDRGTTSRRISLSTQSIVQRQTPGQTNANTNQAFQITPNRQPAADRTGSALQPRSANEQIVSRLPKQTTKKRRLVSDAQVESLAEDGSTPTSLMGRHNRAAIGILEDLLGKVPSPKKPATSPHPLSRTSKLASKSTTPEIRESYEAPIENRDLNNNNLYSRPSNTNTPDFFGRLTGSKVLSRRCLASETPSGSRELPKTGGALPRGNLSRATPTLAEAGTDNSSEPIRSRPVASLRLEDFKVNSKYNQGYSYAYTDVVRNKDDRRCLQGCTKPGCCGERFRALALATRPVGEMTLSQEEADNELLQEFLGDNAHKLRNINKQDREDLLLQAKTRELANKHGRHRHMYEKPSSPPGFWRADFPSTQEELLDRERAKQAQRDQIMQRYEEAMRPGGAFIFRDE